MQLVVDENLGGHIGVLLGLEGALLITCDGACLLSRFHSGDLAFEFVDEFVSLLGSGFLDFLDLSVDIDIGI